MAFFVDEHDFRTFPELSNAELAVFGLQSPHEQITRDFEAVVTKVHDGDTVTLKCDFRDFNFPLRLADIDAPELSTGTPGMEARNFLKELVEGEEVVIRINPTNRVEKWGRLLGRVEIGGQNVGDVMIQLGFAFPFERRREGEIPDLTVAIGGEKWF